MIVITLGVFPRGGIFFWGAGAGVWAMTPAATATARNEARFISDTLYPIMKIGKLILIALIPAACLAQAPAAPQDEAALRKAYDAAQKRLQDWPALGRYSADDAKVEAPAPGENRVVFM